MNWTNLPLNKSKLYITDTLHGGCDIFVPIKNDIDLTIDETRVKLKAFILKQAWELEKGNNVA
jgi:hypothetical protein